jgi:hypothetical protein
VLVEIVLGKMILALPVGLTLSSSANVDGTVSRRRSAVNLFWIE